MSTPKPVRQHWHRTQWPDEVRAFELAWRAIFATNPATHRPKDDLRAVFMAGVAHGRQTK